MITPEEKLILRELAKQYAFEASKEVNSERRERARRINELSEERPLVWIEEIPWNEINVDNELTLRCTDPFARQMEEFFRRELFRWKHFQADHILDSEYRIRKTFTSSGYGLEVKEDIIKTDEKNHIVSHGYLDVLRTEEDLEKLKVPVITLDEEADERNMERAEDILHGIMPVRLCGIDYIYYAPWDIIPRFHGVNNVLMDVALKPEFMHAIIKKFSEIMSAEIDQWDKLGLLEGNCKNLHCTPGFTKTLEEERKEPVTKNMWFRQMAQIFGSVSPEMHNEFDLEYSKALSSRFGFVYYGCCEPLDNLIPYLKKIPNLRKIGCSPWANVEKCAEQIGRDYVLSRKPNPANVSLKTDTEIVKKEITETINTCRKNHCAYDYSLKDISSCGYRLKNLTDWCDTVMKTLDEYYC